MLNINFNLFVLKGLADLGYSPDSFVMAWICHHAAQFSVDHADLRSADMAAYMQLQLQAIKQAATEAAEWVEGLDGDVY